MKNWFILKKFKVQKLLQHYHKSTNASWNYVHNFEKSATHPSSWTASICGHFAHTAKTVIQADQISWELNSRDGV